ncbi:uncharacterized protein LOC124816442 [Hydra vulgaris]|uniref:Uncharacterized protein LOC124816442 n=1 Tax=Hydra vulgaris TaxID=6087 RepID=A0ABM4CPJ5_HYDVU
MDGKYLAKLQRTFIAEPDAGLNQRLFFSSYRKEIVDWLKTRGAIIFILVLVLASLILTVAVSVLAWSHFSKNDVGQLSTNKKPNEVKLYSDEENDYDSTDLEDGRPFDFDPDKPILLKAKLDTPLNLQQNNVKQISDILLLNKNFDRLRSSQPSNSKVYGKSSYNKYSELPKQINSVLGKKSDTNVEQALKELGELKMLGDELSKGNKPTKPQTNEGLIKSIDDKIAKTVDKNGELRHSIDTSETPPMKLYRITNAVKAGALCLDGSPPAYYHRPGSGTSENLWIIHFNGGAWCFDAKACFERSHSSLGSTKKLPSSPPIIQGINSPDPVVNPDFYDWNLVWVVYCDGASFTGNRERPLISDSGETIYMRGKRVLNAIVNDLLFNRDFKFAEAVILTGSSAGSMTAIFQADYIASKFPTTIPVRVLSDAGFFIDTAPMGGRNLGSMFKRIYEMQNSSSGLDQDCVHDLGQDNAWQCFLPAKIVKYVKTPIFVLNSAYDIWAMIYFLDIDCKFPSSEQQSRRKRSVLIKNDSELDSTASNIKNDFKESDYTLLKRSLSSEINKRKKRDVSGFELLPFFRDKTLKKDEIASTFQEEKTHFPDDNHTNPKPNYKIFEKKNKTEDLNYKSQKSFKSTIVNMELANLKYKPKNNNSKDLQKMHHIDIKQISNNKTFLNLFKKPLSKHPALERKSENTLNMSFSLMKNAEINKKVLTTKTPSHAYVEVRNQTPNKLHFITIKSTIPKTNNHVTNISQFVNNQDQFDWSVEEQLNTIGSKRHNKVLKHDRLKSRRSTSIAKEYINILRSDPPECTERQLLDAMKYRGAMIRSTEYFMHLPKSGRFLVSCIDHSLSLFDETWTGVSVEGKSIQQAFGDWFYERGNRSKHNFVDCPYPCNPSCP